MVPWFALRFLIVHRGIFRGHVGGLCVVVRIASFFFFFGGGVGLMVVVSGCSIITTKSYFGFRFKLFI